jgi:hypothetical protein
MVVLKMRKKMFAHQDSLYLCKDRHKLNDVLNIVCTEALMNTVEFEIL